MGFFARAAQSKNLRRLLPHGMFHTAQGMFQVQGKLPPHRPDGEVRVLVLLLGPVRANGAGHLVPHGQHRWVGQPLGLKAVQPHLAADCRGAHHKGQTEFGDGGGPGPVLYIAGLGDHTADLLKSDVDGLDLPRFDVVLPHQSEHPVNGGMGGTAGRPGLEADELALKHRPQTLQHLFRGIVVPGVHVVVAQLSLKRRLKPSRHPPPGQ